MLSPLFDTVNLGVSSTSRRKKTNRIGMQITPVAVSGKFFPQ